MISDMHNDKKRNEIVPDLFIREGKNKYFSCFYYAITFKTCYTRQYVLFIMAIPNKRELEEVMHNHL